jgi:hypothetical protein
MASSVSRTEENVMRTWLFQRVARDSMQVEVAGDHCTTGNGRNESALGESVIVAGSCDNLAWL